MFSDQNSDYNNLPADNAEYPIQQEHPTPVENEARQSLSTFGNYMKCAFLTLSEWRCITSIYYTAESSWREKREELIGKHILAVFPEMANSEIYQHYLSMKEIDVPFEGEEYYHTWKKWIKFHGYPSEDGVCLFLQDATLIKDNWYLAKNQLEAILQGVADSILILDTAGKVIYANKAAAQLMDCESVEQLLQVSLADVISNFVIADEIGQVLPASEYPGYRALLEAKASQACVRFVNKRTGEQRWGIVQSLPVMREQGKVTQVVSIFHDITEFKDLEERKDAFIRRASHELRTPLTSLGVLTQIMRKQCMARQDKQLLLLLDRIEHQLERLAYLVDDLLDLSAFQAGTVILHMETFDFSAILHEIVDTLQHATSTHKLILECPPGISVIGDKRRIRQVGFNLLTNAIKYSRDANQVIVRVMTTPDWIQVSVQDFGIGIAEYDLPHVFERFYQMAEPIEKTFPGLGIGLYMCSEILKQHHGYIWVESKKNQGSTFSFSLPTTIFVENNYCSTAVP
jgi:signal transduction histidine kinase